MMAIRTLGAPGGLEPTGEGNTRFEQIAATWPTRTQLGALHHSRPDVYGTLPQSWLGDL